MTLLTRTLTLLAGLLLLAACSPKYDWREIHVSQGQYVAAFPAKPSSETRDTQLAGKTVSMTMSSSLVDGVTFAVASAAMPDAAQARAAVPVLKQGLLANINGQLKQESVPRLGQGEGLQIEAVGNQQQHGKLQPIVIHARFIAHKQWVYQLVVMGPSTKIVRDTIDTFFTSFKVE